MTTQQTINNTNIRSVFNQVTDSSVNIELAALSVKENISRADVIAAITNFLNSKNYVDDDVRKALVNDAYKYLTKPIGSIPALLSVSRSEALKAPSLKNTLAELFTNSFSEDMLTKAKSTKASYSFINLIVEDKELAQALFDACTAVIAENADAKNIGKKLDNKTLNKILKKSLSSTTKTTSSGSLFVFDPDLKGKAKLTKDEGDKIPSYKIDGKNVIKSKVGKIGPKSYYFKTDKSAYDINKELEDKMLAKGLKPMTLAEAEAYFKN